MQRIGQDPDEVGGRSNGFGRAGRPEEIAWPILFLVSAAASFLSGQTIYVGGPPAVPGFAAPGVAPDGAAPTSRGAPDRSARPPRGPAPVSDRPAVRVDLLRQARAGLPAQLNAGMLFGEGASASWAGCLLGRAAPHHHLRQHHRGRGPRVGGPAVDVVARAYGLPRRDVESLAQLNDRTPSSERVAAVAPASTSCSGRRAVTRVDGGELVRARLRREGVTHVFGLGGGHINPTWWAVREDRHDARRRPPRRRRGARRRGLGARHPGARRVRRHRRAPGSPTR